MATHGDHRSKDQRPPQISADGARPSKGSFPGTVSDEWHRALTGRQAPEPVGARLRTIYGNIVAEQLPDNMLELLAKLDSQSSEQK